MIKATLLRAGMIIKHDGDLHVVYSVDHRTPGNKRAAMQTKMRNLRTGSMMDYRFRAEETIEKVVVDELEFEYLYSDGEGHHFMDSENYEQLALQNDIVGDTKDYLIPNMPVKIEYYDGKPIGVLLPDTVDLAVVDTEPSIQKATASAVMKPAKLENGAGGERSAVRQHGRQNQSGHLRRPLHSARAVNPGRAAFKSERQIPHPPQIGGILDDNVVRNRAESPVATPNVRLRIGPLENLDAWFRARSACRFSP